MIHLGDITKIEGAKAPSVDCIIGGSPCQDLSVAGKRAGLAGERSGLFMEQIRIIKEMRDNDRRTNGRTGVDIRPRYMVWENVPGAFSSNGGEDFRAVLEETAKVAEDSVSIPRPEKGKWANAGLILGDGWSIAWRVFDAQFWGVPQRRRRIALVADFGGQSAGEILFVRKSVSGDTEPSGTKKQNSSSNAPRGTGAGYPAFTMQDREGCAGGGKGLLIQEEKATSLRTENYMAVLQPCNWDGSQVTGTLTANNAGGSQRMPDKDNFNCVIQPKTYAVDMGAGKSSCDVLDGKAPTLATTHYGEPVVCFEPGAASRLGGYVNEDICSTLRANMGDNQPAVVYDARGLGDGKTVCTLTGDHENRVTDYTALAVFRKQGHPRNSEEGQGWEETDKSDTLNVFDNSESRTPTVVVNKMYQDKCGALSADDYKGANRQYVEQDKLIVSLDRASFNQGANAQYQAEIRTDGIQPTLTARGPGAVSYLGSSDGDIAGTLDASYYKGCGRWQGRERTILAYGLATQSSNGIGACMEEKSPALIIGDNPGYQNGVMEAKAVDLTNLTETDVNGSLQACAAHNTHSNNVVRIRYIVRRLTPLECERLQGYPDGWTDIGEFMDTKGKRQAMSDSARYKALGNSIALPSWRWVLKRLSAVYERTPTMASLFDGIGGFPLIWESINGKGTAIWASEIEEFPIAVTKRRIG